MASSKIDRMIDDAAHSTLDRAGLLDLFRGTFAHAGDAELFEPRAVAVLDAAAVR